MCAVCTVHNGRLEHGIVRYVRQIVALLQMPFIPVNNYESQPKCSCEGEELRCLVCGKGFLVVADYQSHVATHRSDPCPGEH